MSTNEKKRKRLKNTTTEQYQLYIEAIENDYVLKSNTLNPTLEPNYLTKKWEELSHNLNAIGKGPALSIEEWKKRFADWRYATKAKFRKIHNYRIQTGGGPAIDTKLSPLEERALSAWGMVTVEGNTMVTNYEGIPINVNDVSYNMVEIINSESEPLQEGTMHNVQDEDEENETLIINVENFTQTPSTSGKQKSGRPKPLTMLAENLINITKSNNTITQNLTNQIEKIRETYLNVENKKHELEKKKLDFEIKKFKFLHPDFNLEH